MAENKKEEQKRETKAGLMNKNGGDDEIEKTDAKSEETTENTPKISKDKAGNHNDEPLH